MIDRKDAQPEARPAARDNARLESLLTDPAHGSAHAVRVAAHVGAVLADADQRLIHVKDAMGGGDAEPHVAILGTAQLGVE